MVDHHFVLDQRDHRIPPSEGKNTNLQKCKKELKEQHSDGRQSDNCFLERTDKAKVSVCPTRLLYLRRDKTAALADYWNHVGSNNGKNGGLLTLVERKKDKTQSHRTMPRDISQNNLTYTDNLTTFYELFHTHRQNYGLYIRNLQKSQTKRYAIHFFLYLCRDFCTKQ